MAIATLDLSNDWQFKEYPASARRMRDLDGDDWMAAHVPCSIFTSLIDAGKIDRAKLLADPEDFQWVSDKPWVYKKTFAAAELSDCDRVELVFDGLDTVANIWLNNKLIAKTNNMFIGHRFDVTGLLKPNGNCLLVKFTPAVEYGQGLMSRYGKLSEDYHSDPSRGYVRKAQCQFGWDWAPGLCGCGIFRPVRLEGTKKARIDNIHIRTIDCHENFADIRIAVRLAKIGDDDINCKLTICGNESNIEQDLHFNGQEDFQSVVIRIDRPSLWRPKGYGQPHLYQFCAELFCNGKTLDKKSRSFGIRMAHLNRHKDEYGESFQFEINGQSVYAKGANWVPISLFAGAATEKDYEKLLTLAAEANINMLRVWGGGYYENDIFYELCDRLGIMVWQDFAFACAYYPDRSWFADEVKTEAAAVVRRLRNHPSIVLWCGNNEIDWIHSMGNLGTGKKFYGKNIYHKLLPAVLEQLDPDRDYISSTPLGRKKQHNQPDCGTVHQWQVWSGKSPTRQYICSDEDIPRFVAEFGMQAAPAVETLKKFVPQDQWHIASATIEKHNYQMDGNALLQFYISELFAPAGTVEEFVYLSQVTQARGVKKYVEHLRGHNFRNSGVLFWQFNESFPAISWSAVDHCQNPKALYYYARRFFSPVLTTVVMVPAKQDSFVEPQLKPVRTALLNDRPEPLTCMLTCKLKDFAFNTLDEISGPVSIGAFGRHLSHELPKAFVQPAEPGRSFLHITAAEHGRIIAENSFFYLPDKYLSLPETRITTELEHVKGGKWRVKLKAAAPVRDVQIIADPSIRLDDNFIDLLSKRAYEFIVESAEDSAEAKPIIQLRSVGKM